MNLIYLIEMSSHQKQIHYRIYSCECFSYILLLQNFHNLLYQEKISFLYYSLAIYLIDKGVQQPVSRVGWVINLVSDWSPCNSQTPWGTIKLLTGSSVRDGRKVWGGPGGAIRGSDPSLAGRRKLSSTPGRPHPFSFNQLP